jgi:protein O-GlcNAc transferase
LTTLDALAHGIPVVTLPSDLVRGRYTLPRLLDKMTGPNLTWAWTFRFTLALYEQMGVLDCIASSPSGYVDTAIRLAEDAQFRTEVAQQIVNKYSDLSRNHEAAQEWEAMFLRVAAAEA